MKVFTFLVVASFVVLLVYASFGLPGRGEVDAPLHREQSAAGTPAAAAYYIRKAYADAATPNMVTVVLADYRGYDTLGETLVVLTAGIACLMILGRTE